MLKTIITLFLLISSVGIFAKGLTFFEYPDSLKEGADAVVVYDHLVYERSSLSGLIEKRSSAITVLNSDGKANAAVAVNYDNLSKINVFKCDIYNSIGEKVKTYKSKDIVDFSHYSDFTFFSDNRIKGVQAAHTSYPFTVVFSYEKEYDGFYMLNGWCPVQGYDIAVCESSLTVKSEGDFPFMFKAMQDTLLEHKKETDQSISYKLSNFKALKKEHYSPTFTDQVPQIFIAPRDFSFDGHKGCNASWHSAGAFTYSLFYDEDELSDATKADLDKIKGEADSERELIKKVYQYMQSKTRYVGVQVGIGGWQPMSSMDVDETGYGDCKGLSYYTRAMLKYLDVESVFIVVGSGSTRIRYDDFTTNQTNHAILCVPTSTDTIWLECTSQSAPFDYLSSSCTDRKVLLVKKEGGALCYISQRSDNVKTRKLQIKYLDEKLLCDDMTTYSGSFFDDYWSINMMSDREMLKYLERATHGSDVSISNCFASINEDSALLKVNKSYSTSSGVTKAGDRLFLDINPCTRLSNVKKQRAERRTDLSLGTRRTFKDSVSFEIRKGYEVEFLPPPFEHESEFYSFKCSIVMTGNHIEVVRSLTYNGGLFPKERYQDFIKDINMIAKNDKSQAILKKV